MKKCGAWVPNTAYIDVGSYSWGLLSLKLYSTKSNLQNKWESKGLNVRYSKGVRSKDVLSHLSADDIYSYAYLGHGAYGLLIVAGEKEDDGDITVGDIIKPGRYVDYQIPEMHLIACETSDGRSSWIKNVTPDGQLKTIKGELRLYKDRFPLPYSFDY
jgi:hypothetical protein